MSMDPELQRFLKDLDDAIDRPVDRPIHPAALPVEELLKDCHIDKGRSSGPGGQHRNKVSTHVTITHEGTGLTGQAGERRSAEMNKKVALRRLRLELATHERVGVPAGDIRSALWRSRVQKKRIRCSDKHEDFPAMLAEAMDVIGACGWEPGKAAVRLECTPSQLLKLVAKHHQAWEVLNRERESRGLHPLKH